MEFVFQTFEIGTKNGTNFFFRKKFSKVQKIFLNSSQVDTMRCKKSEHEKNWNKVLDRNVLRIFKYTIRLIYFEVQLK